MSEIQVFIEKLEMTEMTANFQEMSIGDLKEVLVKDGKQVLKDIFSDRRLDENIEKKIKDHRKRNAVNRKNIFKLTYGNMKVRQIKNEKRKALRQINNKIKVDGKSVSKDNFQIKNKKGLENLNNLLKKQLLMKELLLKNNNPTEKLKNSPH